MPTLTVPFEGSKVIAQGEGPPRSNGGSTQRKSLHTVRMSAPTVETDYRPDWDDKGRVKWVPVEQPEEPAAEEQGADDGHMMGGGTAAPSSSGQPYEALHREIAELKQTMQLMAQGLGGGQGQQPTVPLPPDVTQFDFYESRDVAEYQRQNNAYIQAMVQQSVQAALDPHRDAMQSAEYSRQYNSVLADYGNNADFKPVMDTALQLVAKSNGKFTIPEAYDLVASVQITSPHQQSAAQPAQQQTAKPAQRTLTAQEAAQKAAQAQSLPPRSNGVSGAGEPGLPASLQRTDALGRIMLHNQQTGRARPI